MIDPATDSVSVYIKPRVDQTILNTRMQTPKLINWTSNAGILFKGLVLRYLCYFESIFVCLFLIEPGVTFCRYCSLNFAPATTLKNFNPTKDIRGVLSNLDKTIVVKIKLCIIYLKYRFVSDRKISRVVAVPTVKKNGKTKENVHEKHTLQRDGFLKTVYRVSVRVHCYIFCWETLSNAVALLT